MDSDQELDRAEKHLDDMAAASSISEYEASWQDFLYRLERFWERTKLRYQKESWFSGCYGSFAKLRRGDPLLKYLKQARNAETHSIQGTVNSPMNIVLRDKLGRPFTIRDLRVKFENKVLTVSLDTHELLLDIDTYIRRDAPHVARFKSRKDWINPPKSHLGNRIETGDPVVIGKLGLDFARSFLTEVSVSLERVKGDGGTGKRGLRD